MLLLAEESSLTGSHTAQKVQGKPPNVLTCWGGVKVLRLSASKEPKAKMRMLNTGCLSHGGCGKSEYEHDVWWGLTQNYMCVRGTVGGVM